MHSEEALMNEAIRTLLRGARDIAVVGISSRPERASHEVAAYLQRCGYHVIPINPGLGEVLGEPCFPSLSAYGKAVDIVDIFRNPEAVPPIVEEAIALKARCVWMQEGVAHEAAAEKARLAGMTVIEDLCIKKVLEKWGGKP
jgi:predicted CoA-binding protein